MRRAQLNGHFCLEGLELARSSDFHWRQHVFLPEVVLKRLCFVSTDLLNIIREV
jgi:hypothetical protein